ncbi:NAD(P)/FAD-dependent oxidoreductase [Actinomycetospora corticicola]|uniref:Sarcosine oxidase n=1 Tax=Actinomycetospora corticicola TaxID=663602 RepID=A0A7Y9DTN3_9PSEU|nr:FAD-binding oxidoreductase [Actinomycetospora corticicola]NYD35307.1 sarcosine oxidase [Actinomycetospora corticicola]
MRVTVVGAGIVGLATADALVRRGHDVTVLEARRPMGARSVGASRIFRLAHGDPALVAAAAEARGLWDAWSERAGRPLLGAEGAIVSGPRVDDWAAAMGAAGAAHEVGDQPSGTLGRTEGPTLRDPAGGALDLAGAGRLLQEALRPVLRPGRVVDLDELIADAIVLTAGAGTAELAAQVGIEVPAEFCHHVRLAFRLRAPRATVPPAHLDGTPGPDLASTYQHRTPEGAWAIGGHLPDALTTTGENSLDEVRRRSRDAVTAHVAERIPELDPAPVDEVTCTPTAGEGDGVRTARAGNVHVLWGGNLAKFAPLLGERLAGAVDGDHVAHAIGPPDDPADHGR